MPGVSVYVWNGETDVPQASGVTGPDGCVAFRDVSTSVDEAVEVVDGLKVRLDGPNPADSYTRFVIEGRAKKAEVYDVLGRRVADVDLLGDRANVDLNLSSGVYFVRAYSEEGVAVGSFVKAGNSLTRVEFDKQEFTKANKVLSRMSAAKSSSGASLDFLVSSPNHLDIAEGRWVVDGDTLRFEVVEAPTARVKVYQAEDHYKQLSEGVIEVWTPDSTRIVTPDSAGVYNFVIPARRFTIVYTDGVHKVHSLQVLRASDHKGTHYGTVLGGMINESHVPLTAFIPDTVAVGNNPYVLFGPDGRPVANTVDADLFVMADTTWSDYA
ncbi:MAG: T9SS C-terminal target domain-containing protein, partial [Bacteroidetes bacterium]